MIVVVHGGAGAQGRPVVDQLLAAGHTVRAVSRGTDPSRLPAGLHAPISTRTRCCAWRRCSTRLTHREDAGEPG
jgi:nucleoside-diphosphate-sugar epimerase